MRKIVTPSAAGISRTIEPPHLETIGGKRVEASGTTGLALGEPGIPKPVIASAS
jgi:hypothetical protein